LDPVAADSVPLEELLIRNVKLGISILPAPRLQWDPLAILNSDHFQGLLDRLHAQFDLVVIDSAPVLAVADALVLTQSVDAVLMVVRWRRTPRKVVESAVTQLSRSGRGLSGAVLTQVNLRAYQGNDSGYLYGSESNYYVN
jgi:polysaccharide biosynthesis transport protein